MRLLKSSFGVMLLGLFLAAGTSGLSGCASTPPERPDRGKIQQDSDKGMQELQREEDRHGNSDRY